MRRIASKQCKYKLRPCTVKPLDAFRPRSDRGSSSKRSWCIECENYHGRAKAAERTVRFRRLNLLEVPTQMELGVLS